MLWINLWKMIMPVSLIMLLIGLALPAMSEAAFAATPGKVSKSPVVATPHDRCAPGYYYDSAAKRCLPVRQTFGPGGVPGCPEGHYYDPMRRQCMPDQPRPMVVPRAGLTG